jgi:hypothetical protein
MIEKYKLRRGDPWMNGYFKPCGKKEKRRIHKKLRKMKGMLPRGIMNRIGITMELC